MFGCLPLPGHMSAYSSVGRAGDCRWLQLISLGHWFDSGCADFFFFWLLYSRDCMQGMVLPVLGRRRRTKVELCLASNMQRGRTCSYPCPAQARRDRTGRDEKVKKKMRSPGIEPGSITWQATIITTRPRTRDSTTVRLAGSYDRHTCSINSVGRVLVL
jgi:hypothetical protein